MLLDGQLHGGGNNLIDVADGLGAEPLGLILGLQPIHPSLRQQLLVEPLKIQRGQLRQGDASNAWLDMILNIALIGFMRGWPHFDLGVIFVPDIHPLAYRVFLAFRHIQTLALFDGGLEFLFCLCLRFCQHIFDDGLACHRVVACGITTFPPPILSLTDVALAVCSAFCHDVHSLRSHNIYHRI